MTNDEYIVEVFENCALRRMEKYTNERDYADRLYAYSECGYNHVSERGNRARVHLD